MPRPKPMPLTYDEQRAHILSSLQTADYIRFDNKHVLARYIATIERMVKEGLITTEMGENYEEQYGWFDVRRCQS